MSKKKTINCKICANEFSFYPSVKPNAAFCSKKCRYDSLRGICKVERFSKSCIQCSNQFSYRSSNRSNPSFCSYECMGKNQRGEKRRGRYDTWSNDDIKTFLLNKYNEFVIKNDNCWEWSGAVTKTGYGYIKFKNKRFTAHRLSYYLHNDLLDEKLNVLHHCDNPPCTRPDHLYLGTHKDNARDRESRNRGNHPRGSSCYLSKLKEEDVITIKKNIAFTSAKELSKRFDISIHTIRNICKSKTWKHIQI